MTSSSASTMAEVQPDEFFRLSLWLSEGLWKLGRRPDADTAIESPGLPVGGLLAPYGPHPAVTGVDDSKRRRWDAELSTLRDRLTSDSAGKAILAERIFVDMQRTIESLRSLGDHPCSSPAADLQVTVALADGYSIQRLALEPRAPTADDWEAAERALKALMNADRQGVPLDRAFEKALGRPAPLFWPRRLLEQLRRERGSAPRPYGDKNRVLRHACRRFAESLFLWFDGQVPTTLVVQFAALIDYPSDRLTKTHLPKWLEEFERARVGNR